MSIPAIESGDYIKDQKDSSFRLIHRIDSSTAYLADGGSILLDDIYKSILRSDGLQIIRSKKYDGCKLCLRPSGGHKFCRSCAKDKAY